MGTVVTTISFLSFAVRFSEGAEAEFDRQVEPARRPAVAFQPALQES
jgi:hypothetical protein